jgi:hypothetical protein
MSSLVDIRYKSKHQKFILFGALLIKDLVCLKQFPIKDTSEYNKT